MRKKFTCYRCGKYVETEMDDNGDATCPACENVIELEPERRFQTRIASLESELASLESQLADAKARLAGYEVGYDPETNPPKERKQVLVEFENGYAGEPSEFMIVRVNRKGEICDGVARWFPLPGSKGGEA